MELRNLFQPELFGLVDSSEGALELFPRVWKAAEDFISSEREKKTGGLESLRKIQAGRFSPLISYLIATRIADPDPHFRYDVLKTIVDILSPDDEGNLPDTVVLHPLKTHLSGMRTREIFSILQVANQFEDSWETVSTILKQCSYAGTVLGDILLDRKAPLDIRKQAILFAGKVGFIDTRSSLEKLIQRLESRINGQTFMSFAPPSIQREIDLLKPAQSALLMLK